MRRICLICLAVAITGTITIAQRPSAVSADVKPTKESLQIVQKQIASKKAILLDVRSQQEWDSAHLKIAKFMPTSVVRDTEKCDLATKDINKQLLVYVHCKKGGRAKICAQILEEMGFQAKPLLIDYEDLVKAGFQEASSTDETPLE